MRKHKEEILRFANSEEGTGVWCKNDKNKWKLSYFPGWYETWFYIVDDKYAELRKQSIDTGRPIQYLEQEDKWVTPIDGVQFNGNIKNYRLEPEEFEYPIYKKDKVDSCIVKFTGLTEGEVIEAGSSGLSKVGFTSGGWAKHTDTLVWEDIDYTEPVYYYQWERRFHAGRIVVSDFITDEYAERQDFETAGWVKIESSKRVWED